jgi:hypothetical protein
VNGSRASRSHSREDQRTGHGIAECVERILASRGLTLSQVSREAHRRYGRVSRYCVPHNFYYDLGLPGYSPKIEQVLVLSRISNYRLAHWLTVFGFHLDDIPRLQAGFPSARTFLLDRTTYDQAAWIGWFRDVARDTDLPSVAPLGQLLAPAPPCRVDSLVVPEPSPFLYAKIGHEDAFAFPDLLPGSIVRADTRGVGELLQGMESNDSERLFLVEHARGFVCCRLHARTNGRVTLRAGSLPFAQTELHLGSEARILGVLDWELRPLKTSQTEVPTDFMKFLRPQPLRPAAPQPGLREFLERARLRSGFSFRGASAKSRAVAVAFGDERYFCAAGSLANYEAGSRLPVHIHKIISLCILYSIGFWEVLAAAGLDTSDAGRESIPDELLGRDGPPPASLTLDPVAGEGKPPRFLWPLVREFEELPLFLRSSLSSVTGLPGLSLRDAFWIGSRKDSLHPYLKDAAFAAVNRRIKRPMFFKRKSLWEQPLYILLLRDGTYLVTGCSLEGSTLIVHPFADGFPRPRKLRNGVDAEAVGKVTALFRWLR